MSEALKIDFESTNDNNKETTKELWGKANSILMAFKSKF
jgi:hypothetical protein